ncbi:MAG: PIN domain-containing protein [Gammaproteobacteria bacterium]|nr:PIN domain-containing protein [Gammaproteobacteria bacterium]MDH3372833.1 PIN domain-containing protein [Gammaproteobacteria bacterium]MDH3407987.1 PIN domain-containing protein [Gammaproteobacteria bacterium]MDH3551289.1 PIN domain-containing protein [Gammaproteobacteria bacterium]
MPTNYVLIDFENVQPKNLEILAAHPFKILVFIGANQTRLPRHVVVAMQTLGDKAEYVEIEGSGPNALDFHIAYYIGELAAKDPQAQFHVISRDKGFDPLIRHLKARKIRVLRAIDVAEIPELRISAKSSDADMVDAIVDNLIGRGQSRPRKVKTLQNTISHLIKEDLDDKALEALVDEMKKRKLITVKNGNVSYKLPNRAKRKR